MSELGARYNESEQLSLVHITHSSSNGFEMPLPFAGDSPAKWVAAGYTVDQHASAIERVIEAFDLAFPDQPIDLEVHPVLGDDAVAQRVVEYARNQVDDRFGVFSAWWSQRNADDVYPGSYELLLEQIEQSYATVQLVASQTARPEAYGEEGLAGAIDRAYDDGVRYFEVWHNDVLNPEVQPILRTLHAQLVPEAASVSLLCTAAVGILMRRRREQSGVEL